MVDKDTLSIVQGEERQRQEVSSTYSMNACFFYINIYYPLLFNLTTICILPHTSHSVIINYLLLFFFCHVFVFQRITKFINLIMFFSPIIFLTFFAGNLRVHSNGARVRRASQSYVLAFAAGIVFTYTYFHSHTHSRTTCTHGHKHTCTQIHTHTAL